LNEESTFYPRIFPARANVIVKQDDSPLNLYNFPNNKYVAKYITSVSTIEKLHIGDRFLLFFNLEEVHFYKGDGRNAIL
jgi:hypothetical protein